MGLAWPLFWGPACPHQGHPESKQALGDLALAPAFHPRSCPDVLCMGRIPHSTQTRLQSLAVSHRLHQGLLPVTTSLEEIRSQLSVHSLRGISRTHHIQAPGPSSSLPLSTSPGMLRGPGTALVLPLCLSKMSCPPHLSLPPTSLLLHHSPSAPLASGRCPPDTSHSLHHLALSCLCVSCRHVCTVKSRLKGHLLLETHLHYLLSRCPQLIAHPPDV